jgi:hypothetical protein
MRQDLGTVEQTRYYCAFWKSSYKPSKDEHVRNHGICRASFYIVKLPLYRIIEQFARLQCQDPRDKVYGLLGFVQEHERPEVDYNKCLYEFISIQ